MDNFGNSIIPFHWDFSDADFADRLHLLLCTVGLEYWDSGIEVIIQE